MAVDEIMAQVPPLEPRSLCVLGLSLATLISDSAPSLACVNSITVRWPSLPSDQSADFSFLGFLDASQVLFALSFLFELVFPNKLVI